MLETFLLREEVALMNCTNFGVTGLLCLPAMEVYTAGFILLSLKGKDHHT